MIVILYDERLDRQCFITQCPFCYGEIEFFLATSPRCPHCKDFIPPLYALVDDCPEKARETRMDYYINGDKWLFDGEI